MAKDFALDYIDVNTRIVEFRTKHPEGSLQQHSLTFESIGGVDYVVYTANAYRTADDERPGQGTAWEQIPGNTPFTKGSEVQNAETAAWGRAIVAALAADTKRGIASAEEVRNGSANVQPADPITVARLAVKEAWVATGADFDPDEVARAYEQFKAAPFADATPEDLYAFRDDIAADHELLVSTGEVSDLTPKQITALSIAMADIGVGEHEAGLDWLEQTIGRRVASRKHLTPDEWKTAMDKAKFQVRAAIGAGDEVR